MGSPSSGSEPSIATPPCQRRVRVVPRHWARVAGAASTFAAIVIIAALAAGAAHRRRHARTAHASRTARPARHSAGLERLAALRGVLLCKPIVRTVARVETPAAQTRCAHGGCALSCAPARRRSAGRVPRASTAARPAGSVLTCRRTVQTAGLAAIRALAETSASPGRVAFVVIRRQRVAGPSGPTRVRSRSAWTFKGT